MKPSNNGKIQPQLTSLVHVLMIEMVGVYQGNWTPQPMIFCCADSNID